ncbi:hypothetical protein PVAND_013637 [Polypedilum vanderplanki]|uniref:Peptide transporter family 1-like protein n=1 Tax=Polypedilum vanderplanki TaxID=319348 RepID=A0A9J6CQ11_POLVA|nr:hypothetical protein PVAND_013637 [Polypedilum vanderplanki]
MDRSVKSNETPKYPKSIAFIVSNEFCERFNFYGMRTILVLYMTIKLGYSDNTATVLFHIFTSLVYFFPVMGAVIADSFLGKFRTILYLSCVYAIGSRWTFQATRMNGDIGFIEIKPDQMQLINPLLILVFIPLFDVIVYPLLASFGIKRPLQKLTVGGLLAAIAFIISGFVEIQLEKTYPSYPSIHESQMRVFNGIPCIFEMQNFSGTSSENRLEPFNVFKYTQVVDERSQKLTVLATNTPGVSSYSEKLNIQAGKSNSFFITGTANNLTIKSFNDKIDKSKSGNPYVRVLANLNSIKVIKFIDKNGENVKTIGSDFIDQFEIFTRNFYCLCR